MKMPISGFLQIALLPTLIAMCGIAGEIGGLLSIPVRPFKECHLIYIGELAPLV